MPVDHHKKIPVLLPSTNIARSNSFIYISPHEPESLTVPCGQTYSLDFVSNMILYYGCFTRKSAAISPIFRFNLRDGI